MVTQTCDPSIWEAEAREDHKFKVSLGYTVKITAHACNPSYSGGRDQEDRSSKPAEQLVHETLSQKNPSPKRAGGVTKGVGPELKL
jgi:hypothetical protein